MRIPPAPPIMRYERFSTDDPVRCSGCSSSFSKKISVFRDGPFVHETFGFPRIQNTGYTGLKKGKSTVNRYEATARPARFVRFFTIRNYFMGGDERTLVYETVSRHRRKRPCHHTRVVRVTAGAAEMNAQGISSCFRGGKAMTAETGWGGGGGGGGGVIRSVASVDHSEDGQHADLGIRRQM